MRKLIYALILVLTPALAFCQLKGGYEIDITLRGLKDSTVYLAYHLGEKQYIKDTIKLDVNGHAIDRGKETLPQGIYMIVLPGKKYFEILMAGDQIFSLNCLYSDPMNSLKFTGCDENTSFLTYQKKWIAMQQKAQDLGRRLQQNKQNSDSLRTLSSAQRTQETKMIDYLKSVIAENPDNLLGMLVKAMMPPPPPPEFNIPAVVQNPDSVRWVMNYNYNKNHFFDNFDLSDDRLIRTPILYARINAFFSSALIQAPDTINKEIDKIIKKCEKNSKVYQFVAVYLFNHFRESEIMGHDAVMVKLADDIYLSGKADWVSKEFKDDLRKQVELLRPNLIGKKAPNLIMDSFSGIFVSLYDIKKDFIILYFWEPNCSHCKEATPKLKSYYEKAKNNGIEVFAVCTTSDKQKWTQYIEENKLLWINGWDPQRSSRFDALYNVQSTPTVYILDKNKTIIAKKLAVDDIGPFIENYRKSRLVN
jgi:thiol-disulfide isomerase/thioredoxin